nr:magnetosome protein Mad24-1 [Desulfobacteraceae bacterium]
MSIPEDLKFNRSSATMTEAEWIQKKNAFLKNRYAHQKSGIPIDKEAFLLKKEQLMADIQQLEEKNHALKTYIKDCQIDISEHDQTNQEGLKILENKKINLNQYLATERNVSNEITFFETERKQLDQTLKELSHRLNATIESIDDTLVDVDFVKGEIKVMLDKMDVLEKSIPEEYSQMDHLDDLFKQTVKSLHDLYKRAHHAEKSVKKTYYHIKNQRRGSL